MTEPSRKNPWNVLIEETREALAYLQAEDLEDLAARAQCLLDATVGHGPVRQRIPRPVEVEIVQLDRNQYLLGSLLHATDANLKILERNRREDHSRWVR